MGEPVQVMLEQGKKRAVAVAYDWPGWDRGAKTADDALVRLEAYRPRYAPVAALAGLEREFAAASELDVVEQLPGTGLTDFHGLSGRPATAELAFLPEAELERKIALLRACWAFFDATAARVTPELRLGPRGGGRDRDRIVRHTNGAEIDEFATRVGVRTPLEALGDPDAIRAHRDAVCDGIREHTARREPPRTWTVQYTLRRCAFHMLDHAWEMEDRDLTGEA